MSYRVAREKRRSTHVAKVESEQIKVRKYREWALVFLSRKAKPSMERRKVLHVFTLFIQCTFL